MADVRHRLAGLLIAACLCACASTATKPSAAAPDRVELDRQVMIMLRSPARVALRPFEYTGAGYMTGHQRDVAVRTAAALADAHHFAVVEDWAMPSLEVHCVVAQLTANQDMTQLLDALNADPRVAWAQPMQSFRTLAAPTGSIPNIDAAPLWENLPALHRVATGRRIKIAQIDTGADLQHPALRTQWLPARNFVDERTFPSEMHGTAVAGVMIAQTDGATGLVGVAPGAQVMPLRACWETGNTVATCSSFTLAKSLQYALRQNPQVINLSITGPRDLLLEKLIDSARSRGIVTVAAGDATGSGPGFPANHPGVLAVFGNTPTATSRSALQAPSEDVLTTTPNGTFAFLSGSSFAAAHVTGLVALLLELSPPAQMESVLQSTAINPGRTGRMARVDPCAAITAVSSRAPVPCVPLQALSSDLH